jgi:hypothetical protein
MRRKACKPLPVRGVRVNMTRDVCACMDGTGVRRTFPDEIRKTLALAQHSTVRLPTLRFCVAFSLWLLLHAGCCNRHLTLPFTINTVSRPAV